MRVGGRGVPGALWVHRSPGDLFMGWQGDLVMLSTTSLVCRGRGTQGPIGRGTLSQWQVSAWELVVLAFVEGEQWALSSAEPKVLGEMTDQGSCQPLTRVIEGTWPAATCTLCHTAARGQDLSSCPVWSITTSRVQMLCLLIYFIYIILPHTLKFPCKP